ncbi:MAG: transposase family protein, partial [Roseibium sp.]|uniref:transposase family protein n=2 Tax=Roseibium sp. TaxID=1936156 RepID=UPI003296FB32
AMSSSPSSATCPAHLQPFVDLLGEDDAISFLLEFGGGPVYLSQNPTSGSSIAAIIGRDKAIALAKELGPGSIRVPQGKPWIAERLRAKGTSVLAIARRLKLKDDTVRRWLNGRTDTRQGLLFSDLKHG